MTSGNERLLGVFYCVQKVLNNNLAAPLGKGLKTSINSYDADHTSIAQKTLPFLKNGVSLDKLSGAIKNHLSNIDSGSVKPGQILGQGLSIEKTIDQFEKHDAFIHVFDHFMQSIEKNDADRKSEIIEKMTLDSVKYNINSTEAMQLKALFHSEYPRAPLTLELNVLVDVVDSGYEATCDIFGPMDSDRYLSSAVKHANSVVPTFDSSTFL